ncbi:F-box protein [Neochlamydia sp. AcF95]|uniref:F-box/LRR-repeat protein n=1 Tax=Neochlamydia sp. AcF95 TaxID=2795734 RepID=UPI001BC994F2|nr:F-box protein [Neochlamydia sp. AcF95]
MHATTDIALEHLPNEVLTSILKYCATSSLSNVCRKWRHLLASEVMPSLYRQIAKIHFPQGNVNKPAFILDRIYELDHELLTLQKVKAIFKQAFILTKSLSSLEFKDTSKENIYLTSANYTSYLLNINRLLMWEKLPGGEEYLEQEEIKHLSLAEKGELFKDWIERYGRAIKSLQLEGGGLTFLPPEIGQLAQLEELFLNDNKLAALPNELGQLRRLRILRRSWDLAL